MRRVLTRTGHRPPKFVVMRNRRRLECDSFAPGVSAGGSPMKRREFITLLGGGAVAWPLAARAQQPIGRTGKTPRVGVLMPGPAAHSAALIDPFYRGLHELGYIEGQNLAIERRDGDWKSDRLAALAAELVGLKVDII